jgi:hypothetical protein
VENADSYGFLNSANNDWFWRILNGNTAIGGGSNPIPTEKLEVNGNIKTLYNLTDGNNNISISQMARTGDCPSGEFVVNTTTGGVQCAIAVPASTTYYPNATSITGGTITSTNISETYWNDGITYNISEGNGVNPLTLYINYTGVTAFSQWIIREYYLGSSSHHIQFQIWDYDTSSWEDYFEIVGQTGQAWIVVPVFDSTEHISGGIVQTRYYQAEYGISSHRLYIDVAWLVNGNNIGASTNLDGYARYTSGFNNYVGSGNTTSAYFIGDGSKLYNVNASTYNVTYQQWAYNMTPTTSLTLTTK